jgi:DNA-binding response OmpR family regulator
MKYLGNNPENYFLKDDLIIAIWHNEVPNESHDNKLIQLVYRVNAKVSLSTNSNIQLIKNSYAYGYKLALLK